MAKLEISNLISSAKQAWGSHQLANLSYLRWVTAVAFLLLISATFVKQLNGAQSVALAERNFLREVELPAPRGLFYDRNGVRLVENVASFSIYLVKLDIDSSSWQDLLNSLAKVVNVDVGELNTKRSLAFEGKESRLLLASGLNSSQKNLLAENLKNFPVEFVAGRYRYYTYGAYLSHVLGYTGMATAQDVKEGAGLQDVVGKYRLERIWQSVLKGQPGKVISEPSGRVRTVPEIPGDNLVLTLDIKWQKAMRDILARQVDRLGAEFAAGVIVDISNGEVLVHSGYPDFDPNLFSRGISGADYQLLLADWRKPLIDKVASTQLAPGSSYKIVTSYGLLQNGIVDAGTKVFSTGCMQIAAGFPFCEFGRFYLGELDLKRAITRSSNIFFCENILKLFNAGGYQSFVSSARELGMGQVTGSGLDNEAAGSLADPAQKVNWYAGDACNAVIGQGDTVVTPLQMAMMVATIFNGGAYYKPTYVRQVLDQQGAVKQSDLTQEVRKLAILPATQELIQAGMSQVVNSPEGTAYWHLHNSPGNFTGKSGSAQAFTYANGQLVERVNGWLIGTFDYAGKRYAFAVAISLGGGGWYASEVMQKFANCLFSDFAVGCDQ